MGAGRWRIVKLGFVDVITVGFSCFGAVVVNAFHTIFELDVQFRSEGVYLVVHVGELTVGVVFRTLCT